MTRIEVLQDMELMLKLGHIINKTEYIYKYDDWNDERVYNTNDVYAKEAGVRFIVSQTSGISLTTHQVIELADLLKSVEYDPNSTLY